MKEKIKQIIQEVFKDYVLREVVQEYGPEELNKLLEPKGLTVFKCYGERSSYDDHNSYHYMWNVVFEEQQFVLRWICSYHSDYGIDWDSDDFDVMVEKEVVVKRYFVYKEDDE